MKEYSDASSKLLDIFGNTAENIAFLDIDIENKKVTYLKFTDKLKYDSSNRCYSDSKNLRISTKIGRLVKRLATPKAIPVSDRTVELINNHFLAYCAENDFNNNPLVIWPPDKVPYAYLENNYSKMAGTLGASCMRYSNCTEKMDFYTKNNVGVVVLFPKKTKKDSPKIRARALLWYDIKIRDKDGTHTLLDRVYTSNDSVLSLFEAFAKGHGFYQRIVTGSYPYKLKGKNLATNPLFIKKLGYLQWKLPYLDTMRYLYPDKMVLTNNSSYEYSKTMITLTSTGGEFPQLDPSLVRELFTTEWISKDNSKFIRRKGYSGWVALANIVIISAEEYSKFDPKIVETCSLNGVVYVFEEESTHSKLMGRNILKRESVPVYRLIKNNEEFSIIKDGVILPQSIKGTRLLWTGDYIVADSSVGTVTRNGRSYIKNLIGKPSKTHSRQYYFGDSYKAPAAYSNWYDYDPLEEIPHPDYIKELSKPEFEEYVIQCRTKKDDSIEMKIKVENKNTRKENKKHIDKDWFFPVNACNTIEEWNERWNK
jgi:hypothetical protein